MKAAVIRRFSEPYEIVDVPVPDPGPGECLVRVRATGICRTDLKIWAGTFPETPLPIIPGHEIAGELAEDVGGMRKGERVAVHVFQPCGECRWCLLGEETLCPRPPRYGFNRDGGLAEYIAVPIGSAIPFGDGVAFESAAVGMDAVLSPWRALIVRGKVRAGETVVVVGAGGLGLSAIQIARAAGARVAAIDLVDSHRAEALQSGAEVAVSPDQVESLVEWSSGGADVVYEASGSRGGLDTAARAITPGGRLICNGWAPGVEYGLDSQQLVLKEVSLIGSRAGTTRDVRDVLRALERGQVTPRVERVALDQINEAMRRLQAGDVVGRFVVEMS
ncbi:MAG: alcohol dehydrogenase catalytic domain-containing protein [Candidatus Dormibacteraceae bacterium]